MATVLIPLSITQVALVVDPGPAYAYRFLGAQPLVQEYGAADQRAKGASSTQGQQVTNIQRVDEEGWWEAGAGTYT